MSMLSRLMKKKEPEQPKIPDAPVIPTPAWGPGPEPTDLQGERQALIALIPDQENLPARKAYADWLESNGWIEDGKRLKLEIEATELNIKLREKNNTIQELDKKPWTVFIGQEKVDVKVLSWKAGFPGTIELDWKTLDRLGVEIIRMAPIEQVQLSDDPPAVYTQAEDGITATIMSCRGTTLEGIGRYENEALEDALTKRYRVKVCKYWGGVASGCGLVSSGMIFAYHLASGSVMGSVIKSGSVSYSPYSPTYAGS